MAVATKARAVGFNHVALEVGDIEEALAFYGRLFDFKLRGKSGISAFIDLGDQFLALQKGRTQPTDEGRHFGLVVDDKDAVRKALAEAGIQPLPGPFLDFLDPWGNRIEIVGYENVQFTKAPNVLRGMGLMHLSKNQQAIKELTEKDMAPELEANRSLHKDATISRPFSGPELSVHTRSLADFTTTSGCRFSVRTGHVERSPRCRLSAINGQRANVKPQSDHLLGGQLRNALGHRPRHVGTRQGKGFRRDVVQHRLNAFAVELELHGAGLAR
jgi:lactoylglutathione lyase